MMMELERRKKAARREEGRGERRRKRAEEKESRGRGGGGAEGEKRDWMKVVPEKQKDGLERAIEDKVSDEVWKRCALEREEEESKREKREAFELVTQFSTNPPNPKRRSRTKSKSLGSSDDRRRRGTAGRRRLREGMERRGRRERGGVEKAQWGNLRQSGALLVKSSTFSKLGPPKSRN